MADRNIGLITLNANFEVGFKGPLDARVSTPEYSHLTDGSIPYPYPGMVVAVTEDATADNNGLYLLTDTSATAGSNISHWEKVSSSSNAYITAVSDADGTQTITMSDGTDYTTQFETLRLFSFDSPGGSYSVNFEVCIANH